MKKILSTIAAALSIGAHTPASAEQWSFGPFSMNAFDGYAYKEGRAPAVYVNASGSAALVTVHLLEGKPRPNETQGLIANALKHARSIFQGAAAKFGEPLEAFSEQTLPSGDRLATLPVATRESKGPGFLLQYAVIANSGHIAIITVEGVGPAMAANAALMPAIRSARFKQ